jgi:hypothetical protein
MKRLTKLDFATSLVASLSLLVAGIAGLGVVQYIFLRLVPLNVRENNKATLGTLFLLLIVSAFVICAWKGSKTTLKYFMARTKQAKFAETYRTFALLAIFSPISLVAADAIKKDSLVLSYAAWIITLAILYLLARLENTKN